MGEVVTFKRKPPLKLDLPRGSNERPETDPRKIAILNAINEGRALPDGTEIIWVEPGPEDYETL